MSQDLDAIYSMVNQYMASTEHVRVSLTCIGLGNTLPREMSQILCSLRFSFEFFILKNIPVVQIYVISEKQIWYKSKPLLRMERGHLKIKSDTTGCVCIY